MLPWGIVVDVYSIGIVTIGRTEMYSNVNVCVFVMKYKYKKIIKPAQMQPSERANLRYYNTACLMLSMVDIRS